ncbi:nucleotidyltransferase domain-containing protein [Parablautia muri]|uniref:Nucleotidyltransferase domain-containing protein n=1 Tax=Parablautia muri TaxID=2320879 RepID=A0A9X5BK01_9FIRM|nr:nucleotidyltransferase domain-containing protein [Parablautia muri]NBJ94387.1 nucleotidyltransferase domain-containing protein [Parablautia muri]
MTGIKKGSGKMTINDKIINWIADRVEHDYAEDIALILLYGSYVNGTANAKSDVDCYFIPRTERGYEFSADFIIQGVGYDIFPMSWERVEGIADLKEIIIPCVGDVKVLYYHSADELEKFKHLQRKLQDNLNNPDYTRRIAKEKFERACKLYSQLKNCNKLMEVRLFAGDIMMTLADAVAIYNQDYFHFGLKRQYEDLHKFENIPVHFIEEYENVIKSEKAEELKIHCRNLIKLFADLVAADFVEDEEKQQEKAVADAISPNTDFYFLARVYEEISSTFNKIYVCTETGNFILAFLSAVCLQNEFKEIAKEQGIECYDILSAYHYQDLGELAKAARKAERDFVRTITDSGEKIKRFRDFEEFEREIQSLCFTHESPFQ